MTWETVISEWGRGTGYDQGIFTRLMTEVTLPHGGESTLAYRYAMAQMEGR